LPLPLEKESDCLKVIAGNDFVKPRWPPYQEKAFILVMKIAFQHFVSYIKAQVSGPELIDFNSPPVVAAYEDTTIRFDTFSRNHEYLHNNLLDMAPQCLEGNGQPRNKRTSRLKHSHLYIVEQPHLPTRFEFQRKYFTILPADHIINELIVFL
jgi:hypothetical protein